MNSLVLEWEQNLEISLCSRLNISSFMFLLKNNDSVDTVIESVRRQGLGPGDQAIGVPVVALFD
jgi:hypothetical protein